MKKLMARVNPNLWYVMLLLGALAASGSAADWPARLVDAVAADCAPVGYWDLAQKECLS